MGKAGGRQCSTTGVYVRLVVLATTRSGESSLAFIHRQRGGQEGLFTIVVCGNLRSGEE